MRPHDPEEGETYEELSPPDAACWRSYRRVKTLADRTGARLVFGHDADVLADLRREEFYDSRLDE